MSRRDRGGGSVFQTPDGRWKATISITINGKRSRRSRTAARKTDALALLNELRNTSTAVLVADVDKLTTEVYLKKWLANVVSTKSRSTTALYTSTVENHIIPHLGQIHVKKLTPIVVEDWLAKLRAASVGTRTIEVAYTTLRNALNHAADRLGVIVTNPTRSIQKPSHEREKIFPFTLQQSVELIEMSDGTRWGAFIRLALSTGIRQGELFGLRWDRLDLVAKTVTIDQQTTEVEGQVLGGQKLKTKAARRVIELTGSTVTALLAHKAWLLKDGIPKCELVFPNKDGTPASRGNFRARVWKPLLAEAGFDYRGFHHVRHTYATLALGAGTPAPVVALTLGHAKASITLDIYAHVLDSHTAAATATMQRLLG